MQTEINDSIISTIGDNGAKDILSEMGEITIDKIINNDAIDQIPIISILRSTYKIANSVSDYFFIQKLLKFLNSIGQISDAEKETLKNKIHDDPKYRDKVGIHLLEIINKIDDTDKPTIIAKLFRAFLDGKIDLQRFFKYSQIVNRSFLPDLEKLKELNSGQALTPIESSSLIGLGLIEIRTKAKKPGELKLGAIAMSNQIEFILNSTGEELFNLMN
jgi:hypothetical protein